MAICKMGDKMKDPISGFKGIVTGYSRHMNNCDRAYLRPQAMKDGKPIDGEWFDTPPLILVKSSILKCELPTETLLGFGDVVEDIITKLKGTIVTFVTYSSGCLHVGIQPAIVKDGKPADEVWLPVQQVKLIKAAKRETKKNSGGPMSAPPTRY